MAIKNRSRIHWLNRSSPEFFTTLCIQVCCSVGLCSDGRAATYFLDPKSGNDTNPGTSEVLAWKTIGKLKGSSQTGDTVYIRNMNGTITSVDWPDRIYKARTIHQFGITWTFDKDYTIGQFVNRDMWAVGPVTITHIDPLSTKTTGTWWDQAHTSSWSGERTINGSMLNPIGITQGYDSEMYKWHPTAGRIYPGSYSATNNLGRPNDLDLNESNPLVVANGSSLLSSVSWTYGGRPQLNTIAILTVVSDAISGSYFRPPHAGTTKTLYPYAGLHKELLPNLAFVSNVPDINTIADQFARPWIEQQGWGGGDGVQYFSPTNNMPNYGREYSSLLGQAYLLLMLNEADLVTQFGSNKDILLIRLVQLGIDLYGAQQSGIHWLDGGSLCNGRKLPILFSGLMLNNSSMLAIGSDTDNFTEDRQTWYVLQSDVGRWVTQEGHPRETYLQEDVNMPEWGEQHTRQPERDDRSWNADYRPTMSKSLPGYILAARIMGLKSYWNHDALFDYTDRMFTWYYVEGNVDWAIFNDKMWLAYRSRYGEVWSAHGTNAPPFFSPIQFEELVENSPLTFPLTAEDSDGDSLVYSAHNLPTGATFSGQTFSWTPALGQAGTYQVTFMVSDGKGGRIRRRLRLRYARWGCNRPPVLAAIGNKSVVKGQCVSFSVSATDADGDAVTYSASGLPTGATFQRAGVCLDTRAGSGGDPSGDLHGQRWQRRPGLGDHHDHGHEYQPGSGAQCHRRQVRCRRVNPELRGQCDRSGRRHAESTRPADCLPERPSAATHSLGNPRASQVGLL